MEEEKKRGRKNTTGKLGRKPGGSFTTNMQTETQTYDLAMMNMILEAPKAEVVATEEVLEAVDILDGNATSIDFMLPSEEREILEKNINRYGDYDKMQKVLSMAKKTKLLSEDVKSLEQIEKADELINNLFDVMNNPDNIELVYEDIRAKLEAGEVTKAYKEIGLLNKAMIDARDGMISRIKAGKSGKNAKIAIKFTNDSGDDFELGADINV